MNMTAKLHKKIFYLQTTRLLIFRFNFNEEKIPLQGVVCSLFGIAQNYIKN